MSVAASPAGRATVVQLARLGDLAQAWPLIARLKREYSTTLVVNSGLVPIARMMADEVVPLDLKSLVWGDRPDSELFAAAAELDRRLKTLPSRIVVNLNYNSAAAAIAEAIPADLRLGPRWAEVAQGKAQSPQIAELIAASRGIGARCRHLSDVWASYIDGPVEPVTPISPPPEAGMRAKGLLASRRFNGDSPIAVIPGAGLSGRILPPEVWGALIREAVSSAPVILLGTSAEAPIAAKALECACDPGDAINLAGKSDLETLSGLLAEARLAIGVDTGSLHLAAAQGVRCLGIYYGSMGFRRTGPYGNGNIVIAPNGAGYPLTEEAMRTLPASSIPISDDAIHALRATLNNDGARLREGWSLWRSRIGEGGLDWQELGMELRVAV